MFLIIVLTLFLCLSTISAQDTNATDVQTQSSDDTHSDTAVHEKTTTDNTQKDVSSDTQTHQSDATQTQSKTQSTKTQDSNSVTQKTSTQTQTQKTDTTQKDATTIAKESTTTSNQSTATKEVKNDIKNENAVSTCTTDSINSNTTSDTLNLTTSTINYSNDSITSKTLKSADESSTVIYVSSTGSDSNVGSESSPYLTINKAISSTTVGNDYTINIAQGTYTVSGVSISDRTIKFVGEISSNTILNLNQEIGFTIDNSNVTFVNLTITNSTHAGQGSVFRVKSNVNLDIEDCIISNNQAMVGSVLFTSGDHNNVSITNSVIANNTAVKQGGALSVTGLSSEYLINNTIFSNNTVTGENSSDEGYGGAVYVGTSTTLNVDLSNFTDNHAFTGSAIYGGALSVINIVNSNFTYNTEVNSTANSDSSTSRGAVTVSKSSLDVNNCYFAYNTADRGAALSITSPEPVYINGSVFESNVAYIYGGAIYNNLNDLYITYCQFNDNYATRQGGAIRSDSNHDLDIKNSTFTNNRVSEDFSITSSGGAVYITNPITSLSIEDCIFDGNYANRGGAIFTGDNVIVISRTTFTENSAIYGGALYVPSPRIYDSVFDGNYANKGGAIYYYGSSSSTISNTNFTNNKANATKGEGGAIDVLSQGRINIDYSLFENNTATMNGGAIGVYNSSSVDMYYTEFTDNTANNGGAVYVNNSVAKSSNVRVDTCTVVNNTGKYQVYSAQEYDSSTYNNTVDQTYFGENTNNVYNFNLTKMKITFDAGNVRANISVPVNITVNVGNPAGQPVTKGTLVIKVNGNTIARVNTTNGTFNYEYTVPTDYSVKDYTITFVYSENDQYARAELNRTLEVSKSKVIFKSSNVNALPGETINLNATVKDVNGNDMTSGVVSIKINGKTLGQVNVTNGTVNYEYTIPTDYSAKDYTISFVYGENTLFSRVQYDTILTIQNYTSEIEIKNVTCDDRTLTITVEITGNNKTIGALAGNAGFKINGITAKDSDGNPIKVDVRSNIVEFTYNLLGNYKSGNYNITVTYSGGRNLAEGRNSSTFYIDVDNSETTTTLSTTCSDKDIKTASNVSDTQYALGIGYNTVLETNHDFTFFVTLNSPGHETVYNNYVTTWYYLPQNITSLNNTGNYLNISIKVTYPYYPSRDYEVLLASSEIRMDVYNDVTIHVGDFEYQEFEDISGQNISEYSLVWTLYNNSGVLYTASEPVGMLIDKYAEYALMNPYPGYGYIGETIYAELYRPVSIEQSNETYAPYLTTFGCNYEGEYVIYINGKLYEEYDAILFKQVYLNRFSIYLTDNYEGNITISIGYVTKENVTTNINFTKTVTVLKPSSLEVVISSQNISQYVNNSVTFSGTIKEPDGTLVTNGTLVIKLNGVTLKDEDGNGLQFKITNGSFSYTTDTYYGAGNYSITYILIETIKYARCEAEYTMTINKYQAKMTGTDKDGCVNETILINGTLTDSNGNPLNGTVVLKLNGNTFARVSVRNGVYAYNFTIPKYSLKDYILNYVYPGDSMYDRIEFNQTLTITKQKIVIETSTVSGVAGDTVKLSGTVKTYDGTKVDSGIVNIKVNGITIAKINLTSDTFSYSYTLPADYSAKDYNITYVYGQNSKYDRAENSTSLTIKNQTSNIVISNVTVSGSTMKVTVSITGLENGISACAGNIGFKINGITVTDSNGKVIKQNVTSKTTTISCEIPSTMTSGVYNIQVTYSGGRNLAEGRNSTSVRLTI